MKRKEKAGIGSSGSFDDTSKHKKKKRVTENSVKMVGQSTIHNTVEHIQMQTKKKINKNIFLKANMEAGKKQTLLQELQRKDQVLMRLDSMCCKDRDEGKKKEATGQPTKRHCCGVCFDFKPDSHMFRRCQCNHPFCTDCISKYVANKIQQNILKVNCPNPKCSVELKPQHLQTILPKQVIDQWESARYESSIAGLEKTYCPFKNCSVLLVNDGGKVVTSSECPSCHRLFCAQCKVPWHAEMNCMEFQKLKRSEIEKDLDRKFLELAKGKMWQKCPKCYMYVQRRSGCEHILCRCGCQFCYHCGEDWKQFGHLCDRGRST